MIRPIHLAAAAVALGLPVAAQSKLFVATPSGALYSTDPAVGSFHLETTIPAPIGSIAQVGARILLGTPSGQIYAYFPATGALTPLVTLPGDATDMAVYGGDLFVSNSDGTVLQIDVRTGEIENTFVSSFDVQAIAVDGDVLYVGTPFGVFQKLDLLASPAAFQFAGICGGPIQSMALTESSLYLGDVTGQMYVFDKTTEFVTYAYPLENDAKSIVADGDTFLVGGSDGTIHRVEQAFGATLDTLVAPEGVADLWLQEPTGSLSSDVGSISLASGGSASFELSAAVVLAGDSYLLLGSMSGTEPGISGAGIHLALNPDAYFTLTLPPFGDEPIQGGIGTFASSGTATATLLVPQGLPPVLAGTTLHHAFLTWSSAAPGTALGTSNSVALSLVP